MNKIRFNYKIIYIIVFINYMQIFDNGVIDFNIDIINTILHRLLDVTANIFDFNSIP